MSADEPDEMEDNNGTFQFWLAFDSRQQFHDMIYAVIETLFPEDLVNSDSYSDVEIPAPSPTPIRTSIPKEKKAPAPDPSACNPKGISSPTQSKQRQ